MGLLLLEFSLSVFDVQPKYITEVRMLSSNSFTKVDIRISRDSPNWKASKFLLFLCVSLGYVKFVLTVTLCFAVRLKLSKLER